MKFIVGIIVSYLLGSIPFSYLFSKLRGVDPRKVGTGNVGASNVIAVAGPLPGFFALLGDLGKGFLTIVIARHFGLSDWGIALCGLTAVAGHDFPVYLRFQGGKGVATTLGVLLVFDPLFTILLVLFWLLTMLVTRYFIPSTILVFAFLPIMMWMGSWKVEYIFFGVGAFLLAVYAHRNDLRRFFMGEELTIPQSLAKYLSKKSKDFCSTWVNRLSITL